MSTAELLQRLEHVKRTAPDRWLARCPGHEDRSPSLSIRELADGRTLLHCFAGCDAIDVLHALGLEWPALCPRNVTDHLDVPNRIAARDLLEIISEETSVVAIIAADLLEKRSITESDWQRLAKAVVRIGAARDHVR